MLCKYDIAINRSVIQYDFYRVQYTWICDSSNNAVKFTIGDGNIGKIRFVFNGLGYNGSIYGSNFTLYRNSNTYLNINNNAESELDKTLEITDAGEYTIKSSNGQGTQDRRFIQPGYAIVEQQLANANFKKAKCYELKTIGKYAKSIIFGMLPDGIRRDGN